MILKGSQTLFFPFSDDHTDSFLNLVGGDETCISINKRALSNMKMSQEDVKSTTDI